MDLTLEASVELETAPKRAALTHGQTPSLETQEQLDLDSFEEVELDKSIWKAFEDEEEEQASQQEATSQSLFNLASLAEPPADTSSVGLEKDSKSLSSLIAANSDHSEPTLPMSLPHNNGSASLPIELDLPSKPGQSASSISLAAPQAPQVQEVAAEEPTQSSLFSEYTVDLSSIRSPVLDEPNPSIPPSMYDPSASPKSWATFLEVYEASASIGVGVLFEDARTNHHPHASQQDETFQQFLEYHPIGFAVCLSASKTVPAFLPLDEVHAHPSPNAVPSEKLWTFLFNMFENSKVRKFAWNAKDLLKPLLTRKRGLRPLTLSDPQIAAWLLSPELLPSYNSFPAVTTHYLKDKSFINRSPEANLARDVLIAMQLGSQLESRLQTDNLFQVYEEQEMPLVPHLSLMEMDGILFENEQLIASERRMHEMLQDLEKLAIRVCGFPVTLASPKQVADVIFNKLKLRPPKNKERLISTGRRQSTTEAILKAVSSQHPLPEIVLRYRQIQKFLSNWVSSLNRFKVMGTLHSNWSQTAAATGRVTSSRPNLQNLPRASLALDSVCRSAHIGSIALEHVAPSLSPSQPLPSISVRSAFVARPGMVFVGADFSQLEMRLLAHVAQEESLIEFFNQGKDIHAQVAAKWKNIPLDKVTNDDRTSTKRLVYGIMYGMGPVSLADHLGVGYDVAKRFLEQFLAAYPAIQTFIERTKLLARSRGWVRTLFGRRRLLDYDSATRKDYEGMDMDDEDAEEEFGDMDWPGPENVAAELPHDQRPASGHLKDVKRPDRQAVNSIIQGTAADIVKRAMIRIDEDVRATFCAAVASGGKIDGHDGENSDTRSETVLNPARQLGAEGPSSPPVPVRLLLQIHDELLYECPEALAPEMAKIIKRDMENVVSFSVPLTVQVREGKSWGAMRSIKVDGSAPLRTAAGFSDASYNLDTSFLTSGAASSGKSTVFYGNRDESLIDETGLDRTVTGELEGDRHRASTSKDSDAEKLFDQL